MRIAAVQLDIQWEDKAANYKRVRRLLDDAPPAPGSLIVLPEMFATGFSMNVRAIAEGPDGPTHDVPPRAGADVRVCGPRRLRRGGSGRARP
ncbi:MAG: hypothetical protein HC888_18500 [Candidatus Competibacteraceae bacterium]|nr:hypothetical protein [Candidatus Competibacteraceae bacterium]